jgi:hypothetical protein
MNSQDAAANNTEQPKVIVLDEFAAIGKSLKGHPERERILKKIQNYQSQVLGEARNKKD